MKRAAHSDEVPPQSFIASFSSRFCFTFSSVVLHVFVGLRRLTCSVESFDEASVHFMRSSQQHAESEEHAAAERTDLHPGVQYRTLHS